VSWASLPSTRSRFDQDPFLSTLLMNITLPKVRNQVVRAVFEPGQPLNYARKTDTSAGSTRVAISALYFQEEPHVDWLTKRSMLRKGDTVYIKPPHAGTQAPRWQTCSLPAYSSITHCHAIGPKLLISKETAQSVLWHCHPNAFGC